MPPKDSIANTFMVSIVCALFVRLLVSGAAVALKPLAGDATSCSTDRGISLRRPVWRKIRQGAERKEVEELFDSRVTRELVDLDTASMSAMPIRELRTPESRQGCRNERSLSRASISGIATAKRRLGFTWSRMPAASIEQVIVPVYGMGLWSTLYGYVAVDRDLRTDQGIDLLRAWRDTGLGGEVENPSWKAKWIGKQIWQEGVRPARSATDDLRMGVAKGAPIRREREIPVDGCRARRSPVAASIRCSSTGSATRASALISRNLASQTRSRRWQAPTAKEVLLKPIFDNNPIGLQVLGICSALAVTTQMSTSLGDECRGDLVTGLLSAVGQPDPASHSK